MSAGTGSAPTGRLRRYRAGGGDGENSGSPGSYSGFVGLMRYLVPAMAATLLALVVGWPLISGGEQSFYVPLSEDEGIDGRLTMVNASYRGTDAKNRPFAIRGEEAFQPESESPIVHLSGIEADIFADQARSQMLTMTANEGLYQRDVELLDLQGDVTVRSDAGHEFRTASAYVDLPAGIASGDQPVSGKGPHGLLEAGNFALMERGQLMTFGGRVRMTLFPHTVWGSDGDSGRRGDGSRS